VEAKILIIEDDPEIVESVSLAFRYYWPEAQIISSHSGVKGIEMVKSESPDAVILDLGLPDINGHQVLSQIRLFSAVPIVILTVRSQEEDVVKALEGEANDYVVKPFRQKELLARMRSLVSSRMSNELRFAMEMNATSIDSTEN
jgi:DNA-binding response OmpR family regulator